LCDVVPGVENLIVSEYDYTLTRLSVGSYRLSVVYHYYTTEQYEFGTRRGPTRSREVHIDVDDIFSPDVERISFYTSYNTKNREWRIDFEVGLDYYVVLDMFEPEEDFLDEDSPWDNDDSD
jgi:hypothetical protein